jgi:hypothetical protein
MSVRKTNLLKQNDATWTYSASARDGKASATIAYKDDFQGWASRCPFFGSAHPDLPGFVLKEISAAREEGDQIKVALNYEVASESTEYPGRDPSAENPEIYSVQISSREEHILANSYCDPIPEAELKALYAISNGSKTDDAGAAYEDSVTSTEGVAVLAKIRKGNVAYKTGGLIYVARKTVKNLDEVNWAGIGKYSAPPGPAGADPENWLYIGATADPSDTGKFWTLERQWEFSPDGWDEDLYAPPP